MIRSAIYIAVGLGLGPDLRVRYTAVDAHWWVCRVGVWLNAAGRVNVNCCVSGGRLLGVEM